MISAVIGSFLRAKLEHDYFEKYIDAMPPEARPEARERREAMLRTERDNAKHRELCNAIRSTSFWRFGA